MKYTPEYYQEAQKEVTEFLKKEDFKGYSIDVPEGLNTPPVIVICRVMSEGKLPFEDQELLTRHCIKGKLISVFYDGKELVNGKFIMNNLNDPFDLFPVFTEHPMALNTLIEICMGFVTKKYLPPSNAIPAPEEVKAQLKP